MTTTTIERQHCFTAKITSKGKQQSRDGWTLTVDWKLPGSGFALVLYGQDWQIVEGYNVGDVATFTINIGNLGKNRQGQFKEGKYPADFFWDIMAIEPPWDVGDDDMMLGASEGTTEAVQAPPRPTPQPAPNPSRRPEGGMPSEPPPHIPNPAAVGACQNHAVDFITVGILQVPEGRTLVSFIREVRDRFYWDINQAPVEPRHFCYQHDMERSETTDGRWAHELPDQSVDGSEIVYFCIEDDEPVV